MPATTHPAVRRLASDQSALLGCGSLLRDLGDDDPDARADALGLYRSLLADVAASKVAVVAAFLAGDAR